MEQEQISRLLDKYLAGHCTPEETQAVHDWLNSRPQQDKRWREMSGPAQQAYLAELFGDVRRTIEGNGMRRVPEVGDDGDVRSAQVTGDDADVHDPRMAAGDGGVHDSRAAADGADMRNPRSAVADTDVHDPRMAASAADGHGMQTAGRRHALRLILRAAAVVIVVLGASLLYFFRGNIMPVELQTISTAHRETKKIVLPDGSVVMLNSSSKLVFAKNWDAREVQLEGEAYFEVNSSPEHPFVISSGDVQTRVLGTRFNISAYPADKRISVGVITGKVEIRRLKSAEKMLVASGERAIFDKEKDRITREGEEPERILITPGRIGIYDKQKNQISREETKDTLYNAWIEGELNFYRTPLSDVAAALERVFPVNITISNEYEKECEINGRFHVNQSPAEILEIICKSINAEFAISGSEVVIHNHRSCY